LSAAAKPAQMKTGQQFRAASFVASTFDPKKRTVDLVWTTGSRGARFDWWSGERYLEELEVSDTAVRMQRLNAGAPLLDSHRQWNLAGVIGVVERAWIENGQGHATVRFSEREDVAPLMKDVADGIIRNVSVGYIVHRYQDVTQKDDKIRVLRAVDWEPAEISFVPVGFDPGAQARQQRGATEDFPFITEIVRADDGRSRGGTMDKDTTTTGGQGEQQASAQTAAPTADQVRQAAEQAAQQATAAERQRVADITALCRKHAVDATVEADLVGKGTSLTDARARILDVLAARSEQTATKPGVRVAAGDRDDVQVRVRGMETALLHRHDPGKNKLDECGREFRGMRLLDMARELLEVKGVKTRGMSPMELAARAFHSDSDFPSLLANVANKTLRQSYEAAPQTFLPIVRKTFVPDFKTVSRVQLGEAPRLAEVIENAEFTRGTLSDGKEQFALKTYGKVVAIGRKAIVNDDLDAFSRLPMLMGRAAADNESSLVWSIITANAAMGDGTTLFHASHGNLAGSGAAISDTTLGTARAAMRKQKGLDAAEFLNIMPKILIVPAALETVAKKYLATEIRPDKADNVNPFAGELSLIVEPRLDANSATAWYLAADPGQIDLIELAYLEGESGPYFETRMGFDVDGMELKVRHDVAAKAIDWRGLYKNAGA